MELAADLEFKSTEHSPHGLAICDLASVQPDVRLVANAIKMKSHVAAPSLWNQGELDSVPPGITERTALLHDQPVSIQVPRDGFQVHSVIRIGIHLVVHQGRQNSLGYYRAIPTGGSEGCGGNFVVRDQLLRGRLDGPS